MFPGRRPSPPEGQLELTGKGTVRRGRRLGTQAVFGEQSGRGILGEGHLEPSHRSTASGAGIEVGPKDVSEQPSPSLACRGAVVVAGDARGKLELIALSRRRVMLGRVLFGLRDDLGPQRRMAREHPEIA